MISCESTIDGRYLFAMSPQILTSQQISSMYLLGRREILVFIFGYFAHLVVIYTQRQSSTCRFGISPYVYFLSTENRRLK